MVFLQARREVSYADRPRRGCRSRTGRTRAEPSECALDRARELPVDRLTVDFEGRAHVPDPGVLTSLAAEHDVRLTAPIRADGFDPFGDDSVYEQIPADVGLVLVAGHPAYLDGAERRRAIAPRLATMVENARDPWVGTEGIERIAFALDATQFELFSPGLEQTLGSLRSAGYDGPIAVYAPTVRTANEDAMLDVLGGYVARRDAVAEDLPDGTVTDRAASGSVRRCLLEAIRGYALVGDAATIRDRVDRLKTAGADAIVGYPARGVDGLLT